MSRFFKLTRDLYIPEGWMAVKSKVSDAVAYLSNDGRPCAMGFVGKQQKPAFHYTFRTDARRAEYVKNWFESVDNTNTVRAERALKRKSFVHTLKVGDIMRSSWGYDQTNIDYYEVVEKIGKTMVGVREIAQERTETDPMQGDCVPVPGAYVGDVKRKRVLEGNSLDMHGGFGYAHRVEPIKTPIDGTKVYAASHYTSYH